MKIHEFLSSKKLFKEIALLIICVLAGISIQLNWLSIIGQKNNYNSLKEFIENGAWLKYHLNTRLIIGATVTPLIIYLTRLLIILILKKFKILTSGLNLYKKFEVYSYYSLIITTTGYFGITINYFLIVMLFVIIQMFIIFKSLSYENKNDMDSGDLKNNKLFVLFFLSGFAALIYQVVWQRALYQFFGVNIETVTIIVSVYMLGLGIGSLVGGYLSKNFKNYLIFLFIMCELIIGFFGLFSLKIFKLLHSLTLNSNYLKTAIAIYSVLLIPTSCMGATLPILVEYFNRTIKIVGKTVSVLYFINTLGSALASFFTVKVLFLYTGMQFSVFFASLCNFIVALLASSFLITFKKAIYAPKENHTFELKQEKNLFTFILMSIIAGMIAYIAMSQELIWIRYISYITGGKSDVFGNLVGFILLGIAGGSLIASWYCKYKEKYIVETLVIFISASALIFFFIFPALSQLVIKSDKENILTFAYLTALIISFLTGIGFPLISHYVIKEYKNVGLSVSWIYFANIIGSTLGVLITGFIMFDHYSFNQNILFLTICGIITSLILYLFMIMKKKLNIYYGLGVLPIIVLIVSTFNMNKIYINIFEKVLLSPWYWGQKFKYTNHNRHGIIDVVHQDEGDDVIFGGGIYDGRFNFLLTNNRNMIDRAYAFAALKPYANSILEIGLSSGSWTKVFTLYRPLKKIDVVEINPGYVEVIKNYPENFEIFKDPRVNIYFDDARRWLMKNNNKYDVIIMNTTYHWRNQVNNLLSKEFIELCKKHLNTCGVMFYNTTESEDVKYTASHHFNYITTYANFVAGSDCPFPSDTSLIRRSLKEFYYKNRPVYYLDSISRHSLERIINSNFSMNKKYEYLNIKNRYYITDDNLASEYKTPNRPINKNFAWKTLLIKN